MNKITMMVATLCMAVSALGGVTTHLKLDCRIGMRVPSLDGEVLRYDSSWCENGEEVRITDNGAVVANDTAGSLTWRPQKDDSTPHLLKLEILSGGQVIGTETAQFALGYIRNVTARQLWPHNKVALSFTVAEDIGEVRSTNEDLCVWCYTRGWDTNVATRVLGDRSAKPGNHRIIWDMEADGLEFANVEMTFGVSVEQIIPLGGVQLWENGPYWAECNVGASKPEECGYCFWWGDTVGYKRNADNDGWISVKDGADYSFIDCPTDGKDNSQLQAEGYIDSTGNLVAAHDAATAHLGAPWRMPTADEFSALISNCDNTWTTRGGMYGRLVKGRGAYASTSIFLSAAGFGEEYYLYKIGSWGEYRSSTPSPYSSASACGLSLDSSDFSRSMYQNRHRGYSVRPLRVSAFTEQGCAADVAVTAIDTTLADGLVVSGAVDLVYFPIDGESVSLEVNGREILTATEPGTFAWSPEGPGTYVITHRTGEAVFARKIVSASSDDTKELTIGWLDAPLSNIFQNIYASVTNVVIMPSVTRLPEGAFAGCAAFPAIAIPECVKEIGQNAFAGCQGLTHVDVPSLSDWLSIRFENAAANPLHTGAMLCVGGRPLDGELVVPDGTTEIGEYAFANGNFTSVSIPGSVTNVAATAFVGCSNIVHVGLGAGLFHETPTPLVSEVVGETDWIVEGKTENGDSIYRSNAIGDGQSTVLEYVVPAGMEKLAFSWKVASEENYDWLIWYLDDVQQDQISGRQDWRVVTKVLDGAEHHVRFEYCKDGSQSSYSDCGWVSVESPAVVRGLMMADLFPDAYRSVRELSLSVGERCPSGEFLDGCTSLVSVTLPSQLAGAAVAQSRMTLESVVLTDAPRQIEDGLFADCVNLKTFDVPDGTMQIGVEVFSGCTSLSSITLPDSVKRIGADAFDGCSSLTSVDFPDEMEDFGLDLIPETQRAKMGLAYDADGFMIWNGWLLDYKDRDAEEVIVPEGVVGIGHYAFSDMEMERLVLPSTLKYIGSQAISCQWGLQELEIPDSVEYIGKGAFEGCSYVDTFTFGEGLKEIDDRAFADCKSLAPSVSFSLGLERIGSEAFAACERLMSISLPVTVTHVASDAFVGCKNLTGVMTPTATAPLSEWFKPIYTQIRDVTVSSGEVEVCSNMFKGCTALVSAALPEGITNIGGGAFLDCSKLPAILLPSTLTVVGEEAFRNCDALTAVGLPNAVTRVGARAFYDCGTLKNVSLSKALESLPDQVFDCCGQLQSIVVPASVTNFGARVFGGAMKAVYCLGDAPQVDANTYAATPSSLTTYVNSGTLGWDGIAHSRNLPPRWPVDNSYSRAIATWSPVRYDVTFDAGEGVFVKPIVAQKYACEQVVGTAYSLPPYNPVRTGYAFDGWWDSATGGARISPSTGVSLQKAHTLFAHWKEGRTITVRFNANGGSVEPSEIAYVADAPYGELPLPTREHFVFTGWYTAPQGGSLVRVSMEAPKADRELFAHWAAAVYRIRFHANNGSDAWAGQGFTYGETVTFRRNPFACAGCTFAGWSLEPGGAAVYGDGHTVASLSAIADGVIDLYAVWTGNTYAVRFDSNGGAGQMANQTFVVGVEQPLLPCGYTRGGYVFLGWSLSPTAQIRFSEGATVKDLTTQQGKTVDLYAIWGIAGMKSVVTFDAGDGMVDETSRELEPGGRFGTLPVPTWEGHAFGGWRDAHGDLVTEDSIVPPGEVTLTPDWGISVTISLRFCSGWRRLWRPAGHRFGWLPPLPCQQAPQLGWRFRGWSYDIAGERIVDPEDLVPETDTELYAVWIPEDETAGIDLPEVEYDDAGLVIWEGWLIGCENRDISALAIPEGVVGIGQGALSNMYNLQTVLFPSTLREIGKEAFAYDTYLDNVDLPDRVETIGEGAFAHCTYLQSLTLGAGVKTVAHGAFRGCAQLAKAEFGEGLEAVGEEAFAECWRMLSVALPLSVTNIDSTAFAGCSSLVGVTVPTGVAPLSEWFRPIYTLVRNVTVPAGETEVCSNMFKGCASLANVVLPEGVTNLADGAFWDCTSLPDVVLPSSLQTIGADAFRNCDALTAIGLPEGVTRLGARAFYDCYRLADVSLSASLVELPDQAFDSCSYLNSIVVPAAVTNLGARVFGGAMQAVYFVGNAPQYDGDAYAATPSSLTTYVKDGSKGWESRSKPKSRFLPERWPTDDNAYSRVLTTWEPVQYDVSFDAGEGMFHSEETNVYACLQTRGTAYSLPPYEPSLVGKKFAGWWTELEAGTQVTPSTGVKLTQEHTLYAHWSGGQAITVRFNACGGVVETEEAKYTAEVPYGHFPVPMREHHVFVGWFTAAAGGARVKESTEAPSADVELFAQWTPTPYRIRFNANNGTGAWAEQSFVYGQTVTLRSNTFGCSGCVFAGWSLTRGGAAVYGDRSTIPGLAAIQDGVIDLYAVWAGNIYTVRFDPSGGLGTMPSQTFVLDIPQPLAPCVFTRRGFVFGGWARSAEGAVCANDGAEVVNLASTKDETVVLYAVWERDPALEWATEEYLNCTNLTFTLGGDSPYWYGEKTARDRQKGVMRSGAIGDSQTNWIETVVSGLGTVSFWWKASGEYETSKKGIVTMYDYAEFTIDGVAVAEIGADSSWAAVTQTVEQAGAHTLRWVYHKDESGSDGEDCAWVSEVVWTPVPTADPIPYLGDTPTAADVTNAVAGAADPQVKAKIDAANYNDFRTWAGKVKTAGGNDVGAQGVMDAQNAWLSYALGQYSLLETAPTDDDVSVESFEPTAESGKFDFTVSVGTIQVASEAAKENLKKVFGLEGAATLDDAAFSSDKVEIEFGTPVDGKVKFTAGPKDADAKAFFMKVKLNP